MNKFFLFVTMCLCLFLAGCWNANDNIRRQELKPTGISSDGGEILYNLCLVKQNCTFARFNTKNKTWITYMPPSDQIWYGASYSNDGKHIVFCIAKQKDNFHLSQMAILDIQNNEYKILPTKRGYIVNPQYSKYESYIYYVKNVTDNPNNISLDVYRYNLSSNIEEPWLLLGAYSLSTPSFSPSGDVAFTATDIAEHRDPDSRLYIKTKDGLKEISFPGYNGISAPQYRGDGELYLVGQNIKTMQKTQKSAYGLYVADKDLSRLTQITSVNAIIQHPVLSDDAKTLAANLQDPEKPFPMHSVLINLAGKVSKMNFNPESAQKINLICSNCK